MDWRYVFVLMSTFKYNLYGKIFVIGVVKYTFYTLFTF